MSTVDTRLPPTNSSRMTRRALVTAAAAALFVGSVIAANAISQHWGLVPVGLGLRVSAGTFAAGVALTARDLVQDAFGRDAGRQKALGALATIALIAASGLLSWWLSSPALALASVTAFTVAELADLAVYTPLRERSWQAAVWASLAVGAVIDSVIFLSLAPAFIGGLTLAGVCGQVLGKAYATVPFSAARAIHGRRA